MSAHAMPATHPMTRALVAVLMQCDQPMVLSDPAEADHPLVAVNPAFEALSGYPAADILGRNCRFLQGPETAPSAPERLRACIAERRGCVEWIVNYRRDGTMFWNLLFLTPIFAADGALLHYLGNQRDITMGPPAELPDYVLGRSDMTIEGKTDFDRLLQALLAEDPPAPKGAARFQALVEAARRLDTLTTTLQPASWRPPTP